MKNFFYMKNSCKCYLVFHIMFCVFSSIALLYMYIDINEEIGTGILDLSLTNVHFEKG